VVLPCVVASVLVAGVPAFAAGTTPAPHPSTSTRFCHESTGLVKDLLAFAKLPQTTAAISKALTKVDSELKRLAMDAPNRADRSTIVTMRTEFAHLKTIVVTDPAGTRATDRGFVANFSKNSVKQGLALGGEIKAACH